MRITGPELPPDRGVSSIGRRMSFKSPQVSGDAPESTASVGIVRAYARHGVSLTPAQATELNAAITRASLNAAELDGPAALRALILHRYGIPLTRGLIMGIPDEPGAAIRDLAELQAAAARLLETPGLAPGVQDAVRELVVGLRGFSGTEAAGSAELLMRETVGFWSAGMASRAVALAGGTDPSMVMAWTDADAVARTLLAGLDGSPAQGPALPGVEATLAALQAGLASVRPGEAGAAVTVRAALETATAQLLSQASVIAAGVGGNDAVIAATWETLVRDRARSLGGRLMILSAGDGMGEDGIDAGAGRLLRSGFGLEWRLLAWYRAGRDPEQLGRMMRDNLRGMVTSFLSRARRHPEELQRNRRLADLVARTEALGSRMTARQASNAVGRHLGGCDTAWNLLPGKGTPDGGGCVARDRSDGGRDTVTGRDFRLILSVPTSNLGDVAVVLSLNGASLSATVELVSADLIPLGDGMRDEVRDRLRGHGFAIGDVVLRVRKDYGGDSSGGEGTAQGASA